MNCGYCDRVKEQVTDMITLEIEQMGSMLGDALVLWLISFGVKREDIRLVSIKD